MLVSSLEKFLLGFAVVVDVHSFRVGTFSCCNTSGADVDGIWSISSVSLSLTCSLCLLFSCFFARPNPAANFAKNHTDQFDTQRRHSRSTVSAPFVGHTVVSAISRRQRSCVVGHLRFYPVSPSALQIAFLDKNCAVTMSLHGSTPRAAAASDRFDLETPRGRPRLMAARPSFFDILQHLQAERNAFKKVRFCAGTGAIMNASRNSCKRKGPCSVQGKHVLDEDVVV